MKKHDPNYLTGRDMFLMSVLPAVTTAVADEVRLGVDGKGDEAAVLVRVAELAPDIAACARRIADAVMAERAKGDK